ncbi:MAG: response regulator [Thermodesulfovibrionales bacterium]
MQKKIVLADDNKTFLMYIGLLLKRLGFQILTARNGLDALRVIKLDAVDLVMLDVHMDTLDGIAALRLIKSDDRISHLPVIMISTDASPETIKACRDLGCIDYLQKPIKVDLLHDTIQGAFFADGHGRKHIRTACNKKVSVQFGGKQHRLYAEVFGEGGIYVRTENPFPPGSDVVVSLHLEDAKERHYKGTIIYTKNDFGDFSRMSPGMAIQFVDLSHRDIHELSDFTKILLAEDIFEGNGGRTILEV